MSEPDPVTPATLALDAAGVTYQVLVTEPANSAEESARFQGIALQQLLRTIVVRRAADDYLFILVPGGRRFDWPKLRTHLGTRRLSLPDAEEAKAVTGYERGAITPFGSTTAWPVIADAAILNEPLVAIGGGRRGVQIHIAPDELIEATNADVLEVTNPESASNSMIDLAVTRRAGRPSRCA